MHKLLLAGLTLIHVTLNAQINPVDFESDGHGANWTWTVFENETNPEVLIIPNPFPEGINTSETVAEFNALQGGAPYAGCETMHGSDVGTFSLSPSNAFVSIMVYKPVISDVGFKFATPAGASTGEIKIANTLINQWERLVFDFTGIIGEPSSNGIDQIIVFPDFQNRNSTNVIYFDNIVFGDSSLLATGEFNQNPQTVIWPNPATQTINLSASIIIEHLIIQDVLGRTLITEQPMKHATAVDVSLLPEGFYSVHMSNGTHQFTQKLVIQRR